jgi:5-enolpyruvylshikimate-3-phosphate synthase
MNRIISPFKYKGSVNINSSKSYFQRALAIFLISESKVELVGNPYENDILTALNICKKAGLCFKKTKNSIKIDGKRTNSKKVFLLILMNQDFVQEYFQLYFQTYSIMLPLMVLDQL